MAGRLVLVGLGPPLLFDLLPLLLIAGLIGGFLAGLLGIGGGIVMTPVLFYAFGLAGADPGIQMHLALASSLSIILPTSLSSIRAHHRRGAVDLALVRHFAPWLALGAAVGAGLAVRLSSDSLVAVFASLAVVMGLKMLLPLDGLQLRRPLPMGGVGRLAPFGIGTLASLMGIGGATFTVPYLTLFGMATHRAVGTAAAFGLVVAAVAALGYGIGGLASEAAKPPLTLGFVNLPALALVAPVSVMMAPIGAQVAHRLTRRRLSQLFGFFLLLAAARLWASLL